MVKRENYIVKLRQLRDLNVIKIVTGVRRCGKSTLLKQFRSELKLSGVTSPHIISYNLEEKKNGRYTRDADLLHDTIIERIDKTKMNYVFIDEVQTIPEFEKTVDSLFVNEKIDLYITGSNAFMTSSELSTLLSGRYVEVKMQPLTFSEYVEFYPKTAEKSVLFEQFLNYGGFPEVAKFQLAGAQAQIPVYLRGIYNTVLEKDIKTRYDIRSMDDFRNVILYAFNNIGNITSPNNISNILKQEDRLIDTKTVSSYLDAMQDCFVLYGVKRFDVRGKKLLKTLEKYYAVDLGLVYTVLGRPSSADLGHRLENIVYLELIKRYSQVWIGKNYEKEIDFVVKDDAGITEYFQVAQTAVEESTLAREKEAFRNTGDNYRKTLLTMDLFETDENGIARKNLINWLLSPTCQIR